MTRNAETIHAYLASSEEDSVLPQLEWLHNELHVGEYGDELPEEVEWTDEDTSSMWRALHRAGVDKVLHELFGYTSEELSSSASGLNEGDLEWWDSILDGESLRAWMLRSFGHDDRKGHRLESRQKFRGTIRGYEDDVFFLTDAAAFYEDAWFIAVTTLDGVIVGWDCATGVDW